MSNFALTAAAGLLLATGFVAGQTLPPVDADPQPTTAAGRPSAQIGTMSSPVSDRPLDHLPMPPVGAESSADGLPPSVAPQSTRIPSDNPPVPGSVGWPGSPLPVANPLTMPPPTGTAMAQPAGNISALSLSPAGYYYWAGAEALLWFEKKEQFPANLVTTGLPTDAVPGALGQPNTLGFAKPGSVSFGPFAGLRLFAGAWLDPQQILGVEASGFVLQQQGRNFAFTSTIGGNPLLALRRFDAPGNSPDAFVIASPSTKNGGIAVQTDSQLWGADANVSHTFFWSHCFRLVGLFGFRYLDLSEALSIQTRSMAVDGSAVSFLGQNFAAPAYELTADRFHARSQFFGGQVGLRGEYYFSHFFVSAIGKLALGQTDEVMNALGISTLQIGATPVLRSAGGLYALPSNSGRFVNQDFGIVPELQLKGGVLLTRWLRATIGYDILYWSHVLRAGNALDLTVDARQVPTSPSYQPGAAAHSPQPAFNTSGFWVQGLTLGLEFTY